MKWLQAKGLGSAPKCAEPIMYDDEEKIWSQKVLGDSSSKQSSTCVDYIFVAMPMQVR